MSATELERLLIQMEAWLADPDWEPDAPPLAEWVREVQAARASAEGAAAWPRLDARRRALALRLEEAVGMMEQDLHERRASWTRGAQALRAYAPRGG